MAELLTLTSRRFPEGRTVEMLRPIPGTEVYLVDLHTMHGDTAYAHESELKGYGPDDSCDGWDKDR